MLDKTMGKKSIYIMTSIKNCHLQGSIISSSMQNRGNITSILKYVGWFYCVKKKKWRVLSLTGCTETRCKHSKNIDWPLERDFRWRRQESTWKKVNISLFNLKSSLIWIPWRQYIWHLLTCNCIMDLSILLLESFSNLLLISNAVICTHQALGSQVTAYTTENNLL